MKWEYGVCTFSERTQDGFTRFSPDWYGELRASGQPLECISPFGFVSRPRDPDVDPDGTPVLGAGLLYLEHGGQGFALPVQDPRFASALPEVKKGGCLLYATLPNGTVSTLSIDGDDGSLSITMPSGLRVKITDTEVVVGDGVSAKPLAQADPISSYITLLHTALAAAFTSAFISFTPPPTPSMTASKIRST